MQSSILEQISTQRLDYSTYGKFPMADDIYVIEEKDPDLKKKKAVLEQFKKLKYIQKNLRLLDMYIQLNKGETLRQWLIASKNGMSENVLKKIGDHNNETGGISVYFFNLQTFYDEEEIVYDKLEADSKLPVDLSKAVPAMRVDRLQKRENRSKSRKIMLKELKSDGKGYIMIEMEEPKKVDEPVLLNADGDSTSADPERTSTDAKTADKKETNHSDAPPLDENKEKIKKATGNLHIWIAGSIIAVTFISVGVGLYMEKNK